MSTPDSTPYAETPRTLSKAEAHFEQLHAFELRAWRRHPEPVALLEAAYEVALEAIEAHDWGQYPENLHLTVENFKTKFETLTGIKAYKFCLQVRDCYTGGRHD